MVANKAGIGTYKGIAYESFNELWFLQWAWELKERGYIRSIARASSYVLTEGMVNTFTQRNKRGSSAIAKQQVILRPSVYTPEFYITWDRKALDRIVWLWNSLTKYDKLLIGHKDIKGEIYTLIECKPDFNYENMERLFRSNQKFMWKVHGIYVNLVKPKEFFHRSYAPKEFLTTSTGKPRKLDFKPKLIKDYI